MKVYIFLIALIFSLLFIVSCKTATQQSPSTPTNIIFDGIDDYVEIPDHDNFSPSNTGEFTVTAWIRPATLEFTSTTGSGYIYWLGKGENENYEWAFRMYSANNTEGRENRISFYLFNLAGGLGAGSYVQEPVAVDEWIHLSAIVDSQKIYFYKNGVLKDSDFYYVDPYWIIPQNGSAKVRIGTRNLESFFGGSIGEIAIFNKALGSNEVKAVYNGERNFDFTKNSSDFLSSTNLVALYQLTDQTNDILDSSGNGHNGILKK